MTFTNADYNMLYDRGVEVLEAVTRGDEDEQSAIDAAALKHVTRIVYEEAMNRDMEIDFVLKYDKEGGQ